LISSPVSRSDPVLSESPAGLVAAGLFQSSFGL
jgi:hypothetical protein